LGGAEVAYRLGDGGALDRGAETLPDISAPSAVAKLEIWVVAALEEGIVSPLMFELAARNQCAAHGGVWVFSGGLSGIDRGDFGDALGSKNATGYATVATTNATTFWFKKLLQNSIILVVAKLLVQIEKFKCFSFSV